METMKNMENKNNKRKTYVKPQAENILCAAEGGFCDIPNAASKVKIGNEDSTPIGDYDPENPPSSVDSKGLLWEDFDDI